MRAKLKVTLIFFILVMFTSCGWQVDCPDFDDKVLDWLPYKNNDVVSFTNIENDSVLSLNIKEIIVKHTTHYNTAYNCGTCYNHIKVNDYEDGDLNINIEINLDENEVTSQSYYIFGSYFSDFNSLFSEKYEYAFNGVLYNKVKLFENAESEGYFVKLILANGIGIIGLVDKNGHLWSFNNTVLKSNDMDTVEITNISC